MSAEPVAVLPQAVRLRVIVLAAEALGGLDPDGLPPALRRVAAFTPQRRARVAGTQIALALEADERFRERVAAHVRRLRPGESRPLQEGVAAPAADPVELAALAYLLRPVGWPEVVARAGEHVVEQEVASARQAERAEVERLQRALDVARDDMRSARQRSREQVDQLKAHNTELRRRLAEARRRERDAREGAEARGDQAVRTQREALGTAADADAESRRLRGRLAELEQQLAAARRDGRDDRDALTTRTRLLVDTLTEAVRGLRRELALPAVDVLPADLVDAVDPARPTSPAEGTGRALRLEDPALLGQLLALPRVHLVVDGYNVTKTGYPMLPLDRQRQRLLGDLAPLVARTGAEVTVVFDGAELQHVPAVVRAGCASGSARPA